MLGVELKPPVAVRDLQQRKGRPFVGDTQSGIAGEEEHS